MSEHILQCPVCKKYTLQDECHTKTFFPRPPKFSLDDKYAPLRREAKKEELVKKGLY